MADHTKSINESINCFGPGPSTKWGTSGPYTMTWGTDKWGEKSEDLLQHIEKVLSESQVSADSFLIFDVTKSLSDSQSSSDNNTDITMRLGSYYWEFISQVSDADDRSIATWTSGSSSSAGFAAVSNPSTTWS